MEKRVKAPSVALPLPKPATKATTKLDAKPTTTAKSTVIKPKSSSAVKAKARIELWCYDEYNQGTIIFSSTEVDKVVARAKKFVSDVNVENALTSGEKDKQWEAYYVEMFNGKKVADNLFYAGNKKDGRHYVYVVQNGEWKLQILGKDAKTRFFLGELSSGRVKEPWYLADHKGTEINDLSAQALERKTVVFLKVV